MPNVTIQCNADAAVTNSLGAGLGPHLPVGTWSGTRYRAAMRFLAPAGWENWTKITKAQLNFAISDHQHVGPANSDIYIRRQAMASPIWSKAAGTQNCNNGFSGSNATQWDDILPTSADQVSFASGSTANYRKVISVLAQVQYYQSQASARIVFVFDQITASDYTELWSMDAGSTYDPYLYIEYETASPPDAPTPDYPAFESNIWEARPRFAWTHKATQSDPQNDAEVVVTGPGVVGSPLSLHPAVPTDQFVDMPTDLPRAVQIGWKVRTSDAPSGFGAYSASMPFAVLPLPTVTLAPRFMEWGPALTAPVVAAGPRLRVKWVATDQRKYRVQSGAYDSGWLSSTTVRDHLLPLALVDNVAVPVTVTIDAVDTGTPVTATVSGNLTPRFGLSTHRQNLTANPTAWFSASPVPVAPQPADTTVHVQYGATSGGAAPTTWYDTLSDAPLLQYLWYRVWLIPSATAGPALDSIVISSQTAPPSDLDKWSTDPDPRVHAFGVPWAVDEGEYVYGSRSCRIDVGAGTYVLYGQPVLLKKGRSYVLTGLMKSRGDPGLHFRLEKSPRPLNDDVVPVAPGQILRGAIGPLYPDVGDGTGGPMQSPVLHVPSTFYGTKNDVIRYRTPVYVAPDDIYVRVVLAGGAAANVANTAGYFDAIKLEESSVATPWSPGAVGASIVDAGGVQVDGRKGGIFRYRGSNGANLRAVVGGGVDGLLFAGDTELASPSTGVLTVGGQPISKPPIVRVITTDGPWNKPAGLSYVVVEMVGGGGAGGGTVTNPSGNASGAGGGGAGYCRRTIKASDLAATADIVVGNGGVAAAGASGATGTASTFVSAAISMSAGPGTGGGVGATQTGNAISVGGVYGGASGGDVNTNGQGGTGAGVNQGTRLSSGTGGSSALGGGGRWSNVGVGQVGGSYGGGGGGSSESAVGGAARAGGAGGPGVVIITEYYL